MKESETDQRKAATEIISEQFIPDHVFICVAAGTLKCFDAAQSSTFSKDECFIARKNHLARYKTGRDKEGFEPIVFCFDEPFLKAYQAKHQQGSKSLVSKDTFIKIGETDLLLNFISSLKPY